MMSLRLTKNTAQFGTNFGVNLPPQEQRGCSDGLSIQIVTRVTKEPAVSRQRVLLLDLLAIHLLFLDNALPPRCDVGGDVGRILPHAKQQARFYGVQPVQPKEV